MLLAQPRGEFHFLAGIEPYSRGAVADAGFEVVHAVLRRPLPWREGFARVDRHLAEAGRQRQALCGVELRSPAPFTRAGFAEFNRGYCALLEEWDLLVEGRNPVARTNVAPAIAPPAEPALFGFSYTRPTSGTERTFVVAGAGELRGGPLETAAVVRPGDRSPEGMREKTAYVMRAMSRRLEGLGAGWDEVTCVDLYTAEPVRDLLAAVILAPLGANGIHGVHWYPSRPPIDELDFEMDTRGVRTELIL